MKKTLWYIYDNGKNKFYIDENKIVVIIQALENSLYRWSFQTFKNDWKYLVKDGYVIKKIILEI